MDAKAQRILNIYETGVSETELTETLKTKINASTGGSLGSIKPTDAAPTPARNGNYMFSIGGNKPAWLTAEAGITAVKAGDGVAVVYTAPSSYTYMHVKIDRIADIYNVTVEIPLADGQYYTPTTARAAVPAINRTKGKELTYETSAGVWVNEKFIGSDVANWKVASNWSFITDKAVFISNEVNHYVNFNFLANEVIFPNGYFSTCKGDFIYKTSSSVPLNGNEINFLYFDFASSTILCWGHSVAATNILSYPKAALLGVFRKDTSSISFNGQYRINGLNVQTFNFISRTANVPVNISFATNQIIMPNGYVSKGNGDFTATTSQTIGMTSGEINFLYYDYASNVFLCWGHSVAATNIINYPTAYLLAIIKGDTQSISTTMQYAVNGVNLNRVYDDNDLAFIATTDTDLIDFNLLTNQIIIPNGYVSKGNGDFIYVDAQVINITPFQINFLYFDFDSSTFLCWGHSVAATNIVSYPNARVLAIFKDDIKSINIRCRYKINGYNVDDYRFDTTVNKLILPSDMFFVDEVEIPIYKEQMIADNSYDDKYKSILVNTDSLGRIKSTSFEECINIKGSEITDTFKLAIINQRPYIDLPAEFYYRDIIKHSVSSASLIGKTPKILLIGDSITQRYIPQYVYTYLTELGVNPTMLGTVDNLLTATTKKSEGIGGWKLSALVGASTGGTYDVGGAKFMRLATETDTTNHPTWCFRRTNALLEKNYATDTDKTGNFYIFDLQSYLTANSFATPTVIILAMSVNDIANDMGAFATEADFITAMMVYVDIFVTKVAEVDNSIKVGISPNLLYPNSYYFNISRKTAITYLEKVMAYVEANKATYPNLYVIPSWLHISREFSYQIDSETNFSPDNHSKIAKIVNVHPSSAGGWEFAKALSSFISNFI